RPSASEFCRPIDRPARRRRLIYDRRERRMTPDTDDWSAWLDAHGAALVLFARQWVQAVGDAEDVVQEAFVRFWKARHRAADPTAYLFTCVRRAALDWLRSDRRRTKREERAARPESASVFHFAPEQAERRAMIEAALGRLPEDP